MGQLELLNEPISMAVQPQEVGWEPSAGLKGIPNESGDLPQGLCMKFCNQVSLFKFSALHFHLCIINLLVENLLHAQLI